MVALMLLKTSKLTGILRTVYYLPSMIGGSVAAAILWRTAFRSDGMVNSIIGILIPGFNHPWLTEVSTAIWMLVLLAVWQFGSSMLIFLASLKQIPDQLYEASSIDGAGRFRRFFKVTLPLLTPTIFFNLVMQTIAALLVFAQVFIIFSVRGEPMGSTRVFALQMYRNAFEFQRAGLASAMAWYMLLFIGLFTAILFLTRRFWVYDGGL
jgi:multiple sugar transport system permease protein